MSQKVSLLQQTLEEICRRHTSLEKEDIEQLKRIAETIQMMADLSGANIFIDCPVKDSPHAVVVAEAHPRTGPSLYRDSVVGQMAYEQYEPAVARTHRTGEPSIRDRAITQEGKPVKQSVVPIQNSRGRTIGSLIMEQDISDRLDHEQRLQALSRTTEQLGQALLEMVQPDTLIPDLIQEALFLLEPDGRMVYANRHACSLLAQECAFDGPEGKKFEEVFPFLAPVLKGPTDVHHQEVATADRILDAKCIRLRGEGECIGILVLVRDITELREKERQLMVKSTVIKEIHHRVKNNLQMIASLLRLQMRRSVPDEAKTVLRESLNRILSIASVHEVFSATGLDEVEIQGMVRKVGNMLVRNGRMGQKIRIRFEGPEVILPSQQAVTLALIINELIQNCMEHAFRNREKGNIHVRIRPVGSEVRVEIRDDGEGLSREAKKGSLGLSIVRTLAEQDLAGSFSIFPSEPGTVAIVQFPVKEA